MEEQLFVEEETQGLESLHQPRLTVLLRDAVKQKGRMEAAQMLGVNYKTLQLPWHRASCHPGCAMS